MAFGGLIGKETQVDLSQYVTETELNSKGFATQSWVTQQLPNLPEGFGEIVEAGSVSNNAISLNNLETGAYLFYSKDYPGSTVFDLYSLSVGSPISTYYLTQVNGKESMIKVTMSKNVNRGFAIEAESYMGSCYLLRIR